MNYVFSYLSLLDEGSKIFATDSNLVPVKLDGYIRTWRTERSGKNEDFKRYIDLDDFKMVDIFCWSTLKKEKSRFVNGLISPVSDAELSDLDIREVGYNRLEVTTQVSCYNGFNLNPDYKIWVYIAPEVISLDLAYIDTPYVNAGLIGSSEINKIVPGFLNDYISSTQLCTAIIKDIHQVFIGNDGTGVYILNRKDKSVILLHAFKNIVYTPRSNKDIHKEWPVCSELGHYDIRVINQKKSDLYNPLISDNQIDIYEYRDRKCPWINIMLLRNPNVSKSTKTDIVVAMDNWISDLIGMDEGILPLTLHAKLIH